MTQTTDTCTNWPLLAADPNLDGIHVLAHQTNDYIRRIHWWVRLFGIIWIVIPVVAALGGIAFFLGAEAGRTSDNPSYDRCIASEVYSVAECARMYPR